MTRSLVFLVAALAAVTPATCAVNQKAIDDVAAGRVKEAKASWWGFDAEDSTRALQAAINSGARKLIVDNVGAPWIVEPITLASNQEILFERGVEVLAKKGSFLGTADALFRADLKENITLSGYGATLRMRRADYDAAPYQKAEWRHCLSFKSCRNVRVLGLTLAESGGDGIYLGTAQKGVTNKGVLIKDVVCDRNYRQGISVITAEDLLIENTVMRDTDGTAPRAGIDFEPNHPEERLVNCVMRNCTTQGNAGDGYDLYLVPMDATSEPVSMRFENCRSVGDKSSALRIATRNTPTTAVRGRIEFVGCTFEGSQNGGVAISGKPARACRVRFADCAFLDLAPKAPAPILFLTGQGAEDPSGGVEFANCRVRDDAGRKPMALADASGVGLEDVTGTLVLERNGRREEVALTNTRIAEWMPAARLKKIPRYPMQGAALEPLADQADPKAYAMPAARARKFARLVLYARQGEEVRFRVRHFAVAKYGGTAAPVVIQDAAGVEVKRVPAAFGEETEVAFTTPATGAYRVTADLGQNQLQVLASSHPICLDGRDEPIHLISSPGEYVFWVPAGTKEFGVRVYGEGIAEGVKATLVDAAGKVFGEVDNVAATHQFEVALAQPSAGEVWRLRLAKPSGLVMEDHYVDLRGVPPILALSPEALLVPAR